MRTKWMFAGVAVGAVGAALLLWGFIQDARQAIGSYLFGYFYVFTIVMGTLFVLMVGHSCSAKWFVPLRRQCEVVLGSLPLLALFWVPVLFFLDQLYPWTRPYELAPNIQRHVEKKLGWLDEDFFVGRSALYLGLILLFAELLRHWSARQDDEPSAQGRLALHERMVRTSVAGLIVLALAFTLLSWDWIMSLEPAWFSDMYGVYVFAGAFLSALGLWGAMSVVAHTRSILPRQVAEQHWHAIGRLQLAFVIFWAYIGWAHVLQQWIANVPVEHLWHIRRWSGGWQWMGLTLILAHGLLPLLVLLSRSVKRNARTFLAISVYLVLVHLLDVYYLIIPALHEGGFFVSWMSLAAILAVAGWSVAFAALRSAGKAATAHNDPLFEEGLSYESQS